jgi:hypothetical protein
MPAAKATSRRWLSVSVPVARSPSISAAWLALGWP